MAKRYTGSDGQLEQNEIIGQTPEFEKVSWSSESLHPVWCKYSNEPYDIAIRRYYG